MGIATGTQPNRRMGPRGSATWTAMLDAAENIIREEGYAALTSRRVAEWLGIKQRLVYYYFHTMDDLIIETFRRLSERELARLSKALESKRALREIWDVCIHTSDSRLTSQFMALSVRIDGLRAEVIAFIESARAMQVTALERAATAGTALPFPASAIAIIASSTALALTREAALGTTMGHADTLAVVQAFIDRVEPG